MAWIRNEFVQKVLIVVVIVAVMVVFFATRRGDQGFSDRYEGFDFSAAIAEGIGRENTYARYLMRHADKRMPANDIEIDIFSYSDAEGATILSDFEGEDRVLRTEEDGYVEYVVNVEEAGLYNVYLEYFPVPARGISIERGFSINGEHPFLGVEALTFDRIWGDADGGIRQDNQGNDIRPSQIERPRWEGAHFEDYMGYNIDPYQFYFEQGENVIRLDGVNEPLVIRKLALTAIIDTPTYYEYLQGYDLSLYNNTNTTFMEKIQGQDANYRSSPSLYAIYDRSSPITEPYSVSQIRLNMIGGQAWRVPGQWIEWTFTVPEDGMYRISIKARQNYNRGVVSNRSVIIDGQIPFSEVAIVPFRYNNSWTLLTLQDNDGNDIYFPLEAGEHSIRLRVTLGELGEMLTTMEETVFRLNEVYRKILVLTGPDPDQYRDYRVEEVYPEVIEAMAIEAKILYRLVDELTAYTGERGSQAATALTLARQLERFVERPDLIPSTLSNFKGNISGLGDSLMSLSEAQLDVDSIYVSAEDAELPEVRETFFMRAAHEIRSFVASFTTDYNSLGNIYEGGEVIEVWMLSGRDQSTILKTMIDDTYSPTTGNGVNVKLVAADALMPAVVAGTGPDVALSVGNADPANYAFRNAAHELSQFEGFEETISEFHESSLVPFKYDGGVYGLPETQLFNVMFYRKDIFEELGLEIPDTWEDLIHIMPVILKNNMSVGIPSVERQIGGVVSPDLSNFFAQLFQRGGTLYNEDGSMSTLDGNIAVEAFEAYTRFFTHYKNPTVYDFANRFRTGEMPLGFVDYNNFNTLVVFAPEIRGLWDFAVLPGTPMEDGTVDRSTSSWGAASMMLANARYPQAAWEFMSWWVSSDIQVRFGRELESVMGSAARYATANKVAFDQLSWGAQNAAVLREQWSWIVGVPEVPGGYYTSRHITNAVRRVINNSEDARETLLDYTRTINEELAKKRAEFGLD